MKSNINLEGKDRGFTVNPKRTHVSKLVNSSHLHSKVMKPILTISFVLMVHWASVGNMPPKK
jgi:hypothetical protein